MFNTTNNSCSIQKQYMFNTRHIRTCTRKLRASDVVPAQTPMADTFATLHIDFLENVLDSVLENVLDSVLPNLLQSVLRIEMSVEYRSPRSVAKWIAITGTLQLCNLNKGTQKNLTKCYCIFIVITFANLIGDCIVTLHIKIHFE